MPRLIIFAACERVIISQEENTSSLISVLETVNLPIPAGLEIAGPSDQAVPFRWYIYALYRQEDNDEGKRFEQHVQLSLEGQNYLQGSLPFQFEPDKPNMRTVMQVGGFPVMPVGTGSLKLFIQEVGEDTERQEIAEYPLIIRRLPVSESVKESVNK